MSAYSTDDRSFNAGGGAAGAEFGAGGFVGTGGVIRADLIAIAGMIRARRIVMKMSQTDLAQQIGATQAWVSALENGRPNLRFGQVLKAMAVLDIGFANFAPAAGKPAPERARQRHNDDFPDIDDVVDGEAL